jgi:hypothetical protein
LQSLDLLALGAFATRHLQQLQFVCWFSDAVPNFFKIDFPEKSPLSQQSLSQKYVQQQILLTKKVICPYIL